MVTLLSPITENTFKDIIFQWASIIKRNESVSILHLSSRGQLWRIHQLLQDRKLLVLFGNMQILVVDLVSEPIDEGKEFEQYLTQHIDKSKISVVLFILHADILLEENPSLLAFINQLPQKNSIYKVLFFFQRNILLPQYAKRFSSIFTMYQNICLFPLYKKEDQEQFMRYLEQKFNILLPLKVKTHLIKQCGGYLRLLKEAVRYYAKTSDTSQIFSHSEMQFRLKIIWSEFDEMEQYILQKIVTKATEYNETEKDIIHYFLNINLVKRVQKKHIITSPLLHEYIQKKIHRQTLLELNSLGKIMINGSIIEGLFSVREKKLLSLFLQFPNSLVSREKAAMALWKDQNYTDWALDQFIKRLRKKLIKIGVDPKVLKTKWKKGFVFQTS